MKRSDEFAIEPRGPAAQVGVMGEKPKPTCKLTGTDGNVFALAGRVSAALKRAGMPEKAKEFTDKVFACESYDAALRLMCEYVDAR